MIAITISNRAPTNLPLTICQMLEVLVSNNSNESEEPGSSDPIKDDYDYNYEYEEV